MLNLLAHAGEQHADSSESANHLLESWYIALPLFIFLVVGISAIIYLISRRSFSATYLATVSVLLVSGIFLYDKSPIVSTVAITIGLFGSLLVVLTLLSPPQKASKK